jgi:hypothetical protein
VLQISNASNSFCPIAAALTFRCCVHDKDGFQCLELTAGEVNQL